MRWISTSLVTAAAKPRIPGALVEGAREGEFEEEARKVDELRVKWIWDSWRETRDSGWRARGASCVVHGETEEGEGEESEAQEGARQVASSGDERGRLGVARRPENRDRPPRRQRHSDGRLREASAPLLRRAAQEDGRWVYDRWGPRVRKFLNLNPNFWIVTILPPKRNLVPRFRRKVPN